jgi:hypothetical protein
LPVVGLVDARNAAARKQPAGETAEYSHADRLDTAPAPEV